jgi:hypothetical protein
MAVLPMVVVRAAHTITTNGISGIRHRVERAPSGWIAGGF